MRAYEKTYCEGNVRSTTIEGFVVFEIVYMPCIRIGEGAVLKIAEPQGFQSSNLWHGATGVLLLTPTLFDFLPPFHFVGLAHPTKYMFEYSSW